MIKPGTTSDALVCLGDLMATCADILDVPLQENAAEDSFSFLPALRGEQGENLSRKVIVHHSGDGMFSIRAGKWKLIMGCGSGGFTEPQRIDPEPGTPQGQLYNMQDDVQETCNLWALEPQIVERLTAILSETIIRANSHF
jgi:arylsulfatase A-like enzyme